MLEQISVPMDAGRVCDAIAKIGYSPSAAIMDIVDNSIMAGATNIIIEMDINTGKPNIFFTSRNNVIAYRIVDNGKGMSDESMIDALKLGSSNDYEENSLSKYGMGLKSAGFSLGTKIKLVSKRNNKFGSINYVDRDEISEAGEYLVSREDFDENEHKSYIEKLDDFGTGTIVEITGCQNIQQNSAKKTRKDLFEKLGVVYYEFLRRNENPLSITIRCINIDEPDLQIEPFDILFSEQANLEGYDPDSYDYKTPILLYDEEVKLPGEEKIPPVKLEIVVFPADSMKNFADFSDEDREQIKEYKVTRNNKGFFIYRNGRLIRWGDDFNNAVPRDDHNLRARLVINTVHDEILHVDVSKQNLTIPEDLEANINEIIRRGPLTTARTIRSQCTSLLKSSDKEEGETFNENSENLYEEDPEEPVEEEKIQEVGKRQKKQTQDTQKALEDEPDEKDFEPVEKQLEELPSFRRIRYSDSISSMNLWEANTDPKNGTFVRINKNHPFYSTILTYLQEGDESRQSMEALIWACAVAENLTFRNMTEIDEDTITKVIKRFKKIMSSNLDTWCGENADIYGDD